jgi:hypothetical protein
MSVTSQTSTWVVSVLVSGLFIPDSGGGKMCGAIFSPQKLDDLKKEARQLLHALHQREAAALRRYYSIDKLAGLAQPRLDDAQYVVAREHGYGSWQKLKEHLHTTNSPWNCKQSGRRQV